MASQMDIKIIADYYKRRRWAAEGALACLSLADRLIRTIFLEGNYLLSNCLTNYNER